MHFTLETTLATNAYIRSQLHTEEIITVGHRPFSGQDFHMTDQKPL